MFDLTGTRILTAGEDTTARLWNFEGETLSVLEGHTTAIKAAAIDGVGARVVTGSAGGAARVWDDQGQWLVTLEGHSGAITSVEIDNSGSHILTASKDGTARIWRNYPDVPSMLTAAEEALQSLVGGE